VDVLGVFMELLTNPNAWMALLTLTVLEVVLGIDNIVFISILSSKLPKENQKRARLIGLALAMLMRIGLLFSITWVMSLTQPLLEVMKHSISGRDIILFVGGLFLLAKSTHEIHNNLEGEDETAASTKADSFLSVIIQIMFLDIIFSLDSVITAVGMADEIVVMVTAVVIAVIFMMVFVNTISRFIEDHPTIKMLALSFLLLIGVSLVAESFHHEIPKGYIYFAMAFSIFVELLNLKVRASKAEPIHLRKNFP